MGVGGGLFARGAADAQEAWWSPGDGVRVSGPSQGLATLDPALVPDLETILISRQVSRGLVGYDKDLLPVSDLAKSMDISEDGLAYTFALRDDVRFHDGRSIEAEDVRFSFSRALNPGGSPQGAAVTYLGDIDGADEVISGAARELSGIEIVDEKTVRITLSAPSSTFPMKLAAIPASIIDRHQDLSSPDWWMSINGSGPYRVGGYDEDGNLHLQAVEFWKGEQVPVRDVTFLLGTNAAQPVNLFQAGDIDLVPDVPPGLVSLVSDPATGMNDAMVLEAPAFALSYMAFGNRNEPLDDVHIRRALQAVFPAGQFAEAAFDGRVLEANGVISPGMFGRDWPAEIPPVDAGRAREEIAASRYGTAEAVPPIRIHAADIAPVEALRDVATAELGLVIEAVQVNWSDFLNGLVAQDWDAYAIYWGLDYPDPEAFLHMLFGSESPENYTGYSNQDFDTLLAEARSEPDSVARERLYEEAQQLLVDDAAIIPLYVPVIHVLARAGMSHVPVSPMGLMGLETLS